MQFEDTRKKESTLLLLFNNVANWLNKKLVLVFLLFVYFWVFTKLSFYPLPLYIEQAIKYQRPVSNIIIIIFIVFAYITGYLQLQFKVNGGVYFLKKIKWVTTIRYEVAHESLLHFSLSELLIKIPKISFSVIINSDSGFTKIIQIKRDRLILPYKIKNLTADLEQLSFFANSKKHLSQTGTKFRHFRYLINFETNNPSSVLNYDILPILISKLHITEFETTYKLIIRVKLLPNTISGEQDISYLTVVELHCVDKKLYSYLEDIFSCFQSSSRFSKEAFLTQLNNNRLQHLNYNLIQILRPKSEKLDTSSIIKPVHPSTHQILVGTDQLEEFFFININDLIQGGLITGAIGTGKTTLRLTIQEQLISSNVTILDIDYKGDAPKMFRFFSKGLALVPGKNLHIDIFDQPSNIDSLEFVGILFRSFIESVADGDLSPPQRHILLQALRMTVNKKGNLESFFRNILVAAAESSEVIENYQHQTAVALINKFHWLQSTMRNVFGVTGNSLSGKELATNNIFIDLSYIQHSAPIHHIRFFLDILITKLMIYYRSVESVNFGYVEIPLRKVVFLDETHMFMPSRLKGSTLTRLEELVVTLRHKGVSVIATTTNPELISSVFLDATFQAQFRTDSQLKQQFITISQNSTENLGLLPNHCFYLRSISTNHVTTRFNTIQFIDNTFSLKEYYELINSYDVRYLDEFKLSRGDIEVANLEGMVYNSLPIEPYRRIIRAKAKSYLLKRSRLLESMIKEQNYHEFLLDSFRQFMDDDDEIPEFKDQSYLQGYLYELLLMIFRYQFFAQTFNNILPLGAMKKFKVNYIQIFLNLIEFIDRFLDSVFQIDQVLDV